MSNLLLCVGLDYVILYVSIFFVGCEFIESENCFYYLFGKT